MVPVEVCIRRAAGIAAVFLLVFVAQPAAAALLRKGDTMPAWALPDQTGTIVRSSELAGRSYLLWFYPKARTPGCTAEGRAFRAAYDKFAAADVAILGVSFDDPQTNAAFMAAESFPFRLLSDDGSLAAAVGAAEPGAKVARRISYLVGPDGRVRRAYGHVEPAGHARAVLRDLGHGKGSIP